MAIQPERTGYIASGVGHALLLAWGVLAFSTAPKPFEIDPADSVPVEVVSDAPSQARRGVKTAENKPEPRRVIDRKAVEEKETEEEDTPVAKQAVQNVTPPPPPKPRVVEEQKQVAAVQPVPAPTPRPKPAPAETEKEDTQREAELLAKKKEDEKKKQEEDKKKLEDEKKLAEEKKKADDKKKAEEKKLADAKAEKERQDKANARTFDPNSIASRITNPNAVSDRRQAARTEATGNQAPSRTASLGAPTGNSARLTASEIDALREQVQQCWNIPAGAANAQNLIVRVQFSLNQDGTVSGRPEVMNSSRDPAFAAAANSAVRAIMQCGSNGRRFNLPAAKYDAWREVAINFDPRDMFR